MADVRQVKAKADELRKTLRQLDRAMGKGPTADELASHFGKSRQTIHEWKRRVGFPRNGTLEEIEEWVIHNIKSSTAETQGMAPLQQQLLEAKIRDQNESADAKALKNAERRGELIEVDKVVRFIATVIAKLGATLDRVEDDIRKEVPSEVRDIVSHIIGHKLRLARKATAHELRAIGEGKIDEHGGDVSSGGEGD